MMSQNLPACEGGQPTRKDCLIFGSPLITDAEKEAVCRTLDSCWLGTGPQVASFQQKVANYVGAKHAIALNSCTAGLHLSILSHGIGDGDEVITCPMTFAATANAITHSGAKPVFVDCDRETQNSDVDKIEEKITKKTRAIVPIHLAGLPCDMNRIQQIAEKYKLVIIEDAAHALGAKYFGKPIGSIGDTTCFSFYVTKNLTTGEGGMITTNDDRVAQTATMYSLHGLSADAWSRFSDKEYTHYYVDFPGFKYNMMDIQAAIGMAQFEKFEAMQSRRKEIWQTYQSELGDLPLDLPGNSKSEVEHAYHLFSVHLDLGRLSVSRDKVLGALYRDGIGTGVHYLSVHLHPYYKKTYGYKTEDFPNASWISDCTLSLPLSPKLSNQDVADVVSAVRKVLIYYSR